MPYASSIQVVNDANGTAYAFLADNGSLWQCQWNAQAQRWDQGQVVPGAFGGEKMQALYLDHLWPTDSNGSTGSQPGIVLAYRVGEGSNAEIYASLGQWNSDGQLAWSAPVALTDDQVEDQAFSLMENASGGFSLVVQKQQAATPVESLLDKLGSAPADQLEAELKAAASSDRPDSDLYSTSFAIQLDDSFNPQLQELTGTTPPPPPTALSAAATSAAVSSNPPVFGGNSQLSRGQLITPPIASPTLRQSGPMLSSQSSEPATGTEGGGVKWKGGAAGQANFTNGGTLRMGALVGQNVLRWQLPNHQQKAGIEDVVEKGTADNLVSYYDENSSSDLTDSLEQNAELVVDASSDIRGTVGEILNSPPSRSFGDAEDLLRVSQDVESMSQGSQAGGGIFGVSWKGSDANPVHPPHWQLRGTLGLFNAGLGGPTVLSTFKVGLDAGNNDPGKIASDSLLSSLLSSGSELKPKEWTKVKSGNSIGIGGDLSTTYLYQGKGKPRLVQLQSEESIALDWDHTSLRFSAEGGSLKLSTFVATGWMFEQILSSATGEQLPSWLSYIGYIGGALADIEKNVVGDIASFKLAGTVEGYAAGLNPYSGLLGGREKGLRALQWVNAGVGSSLAALGPAAAIAAATSGWLESDDTTFSHSSGLQFYTRATGRYLYKSVAGLQVTLANKLIKFLEGEEKGVGSDKFFANLGLALPLGGSIPLLSYTITKTWGHGSSEHTSDPSAQSTDSSTSTSKGAYTSAASGSGYPFTYTPQSGGNSYYSSSTSKSANNPALLGGQAVDLQILTLGAYSGGINPSKDSSAYPITLYNQGAGLKDGEYTNVPILGATIDGTMQAAATASFTVQNGRVQADGFQIDSSGTYLMLPESSPNSGVYALLLDVFATGIATPPGTGSGSLGNFLADMPMITLDSSRSNAPLQFQPAQRVSSVAVDPADQPATVIYPQYNASTQQVTAPASNDNSLYSYSNVAVQLFATNSSGGLATLVPLLNPTASSSNSVAATVTLSGGVIQRVDLDQALLFAPRSAGTTFALQLTLPAAVTSSLPQGTAAPSFSVEAESFSYGNVVADEQFSAQQGLANAGVFLASGLSDQLPLYGAMASWPVQNRVAYVSTTGSGASAQTNVVYLNGNYKTQDSYTPQGNVSSSQLQLEELYSNPHIVFSAASSPTAVSIGGPSTSTYANNTFVAWVEASDPVIPSTTAGNGEANLQAFMEALYGNQRINYRINRGDGIGWEAPILADLYSPDNAIIRHLQAFTVANSAAPGGSATLLVWDETSIAAIQGAVQSLGSAETASIPTVIKAGWINPNATTLQWNDLFKGTDGKSTIQTIAWNPSTDVGLTIEDIAIAFQTVVLEDGSVAESPLLSWSQDVRTPYRESVLKDQPTFYLQFNDLQSGISDINIGSVNSSYTSTFASDTGLNVAIAGALPKSQATAVQNVEGLGVLSTGLGTTNSAIRHLTNNVPESTLTANSPVARFEGAITGTTLTVSAFSAGALAVGDLLSGPGLLSGTTITAVQMVDAATGVGTYTLNQGQNLPSSTWMGVSAPSQLPLSSFAGSVEGSVLSVTAVSQGNLAVGDQISGPGIPLGTTIIAVNSADPGSGIGTYSLDRSLSTAVPPSALLATPAVPVAPYTVEFWAQLQPGSNPNGAGLVALGQPSAGAVGASTLPDGWLLNASFVVDRVTYQQAAARGLISSIPSSVSDPANTLYGWEWGVVATGANTTAMGGNGGSNLYSNALLLNNLSSGQTLDGVNQFLANYNLTAADLIGGTGSDAATIANVPITQLQFSYALDSSTGLPNSSLNGIAVDTSTAILNQGLVTVSDGISANLTTMFEALWDFESKTGEAKVNFSLSPSSSATTTSPGQLPNGLSAESYAGYELGFSLARGTAVSVNASGQLVFDIGKGTSITSTASGSVPADLRDGQWHYIVASFLPTYQTYVASEASGVTVQLPTNMGTASLFVDNQLVASDNAVFNPYPFANLTDQALLLANNSGGAIDQLAVYDKALSSAAFVPDVSGQWPVPSAEDALALLDSLGYAIATKTPDPGAIPGAVTKHWLAHTVNPNDAVLATYTSSYNVATGTWSQASTLNPILQVEATTPSYSTSASLEDGLVISIAKTSWTASNWQATTGGVTTDNFFFDPANQELQGVSVTLTNLTDTSLSSSEQTKTINLTPEQVLIGTRSLMTLQPKATNADFNFTVLTNSPSFNLVIPKHQLPAGTGSPLLYKYSATYTLSFADGTSLATTTAVDLNSSASSLAATHGKTDSSSILTTRQTHTKAIATADVVEAAPLQLKYVDSGVVLQSDSSAVPAHSFGQSQVLGSFVDSNSNTNGWLAIAQPFSTNAVSNPAGRVWIQYTGQSKSGTPSTNASEAPTTWLNALANSNFSPDTPNLPLLGNANNPSSTGGLLIQADPTAGWGQNFGQMMLVADVNQDGISDLIIASPQSNGGGRVVIIDGTWIKDSLTTGVGATTLDLSNPNNVGSYVTVLTPAEPSSGDDDISVANFGSALAFDGTTLWIGAPSYLRQMDASSTTPLQSLLPIGAVYSYTTSSASANGWGTGVAQALASPILGSAGTTLTTDPSNQQTTTYWGSQFGTAIAVNGNGGIAVSAPGVQASLLYSGTEAVQQSADGKKDPNKPYGDGALVKIQLPSTSNNNTVSSMQGTSNSGLINVSSQTSDLSSEESSYMQNLKALQVDTIASATYANNQAIQTAAVGAVYLFESSTDLAAITSSVTPELVASASSGGATFYGPNPWNTLGASGFGASLSFADYKNTNSASILAIGAPLAGGSGALYLVDTKQGFTESVDSQYDWVKDINLAKGNQYLAHLASTLTLYGAEAADNFASGLLDLGDVNNDGYNDLLIQAYNASGGAGNGYVLFGNDQLAGGSKANPATGSVAAGAIGQLKQANGDTLDISILSELGAGAIGYTGQGTFGKGDANGDGLNDIPLGSGPNGSAYLTWGHPYLEAVGNLQLSRLTSGNGFMLDGLATINQGTLRSIGDFNGDGYGDFVSVNPSDTVTNVRIELGGNTQEILAEAPYNYYTFTVTKGTQVMAAGDVNGDGMDDIALFLDQNLSTAEEGNKGPGSTTGIFYGRSSSDLPFGSGFGFLAPVDSANAPLATLPGANLDGGLTDAAPSVIAVGSTLYAAVKGVGSTDTTLWFTQSSDGGITWNSWTELGDGNKAFATTDGMAPSLSYYNNKLYLSFVNSAGTLSLSSWDPSSNNPRLWSTPSALSTSSGATTPFKSGTAPQLLNRGDSLAVMWVEGSTVYASSSTRPAPTPANAPWAVVNSGSSMATPALARDGDTVYMAVQAGSGGSEIYWTSSNNSGSTWAPWQALPSDFTSVKPPSLAVVNGTLYLSYLGDGNNEINITSLRDAATNSWRTPYLIPGQSATYASLTSETVAGTEQLAVYYVSNDATDRVLKAYSSTPLNSFDWTSDVEIQYGNNSGTQTASGPLAVSQYNGQTYVVYQGGTTTNPSDEIYIATSSSSNVNNGVGWSAQALLDPNTRTGLGLTSTSDGLQLSYGNSSTTSELQLASLTPQSGSLNVTLGSTKTYPLASSLSNNITILTGSSGGFSNLLLAGISTSANNNSVQTSLLYDSQADKSWNTPLQLQVLQDGIATPIAATDAPSFTWLGTTPVLAVNDAGTVRIYAGTGSGSSLQLSSTFTAPSGGPTIESAPVLTTTDTGLALTYSNSDGSISLHRLDVVSANGAPVDGIQINSDGSIDFSQADLSWTTTTLTSSNSGLSSLLPTVPVSVNGNLLLANVRSSTSEDSEIWINAVPNLSDPDSTTWLNSSVQLPNGSGGWTLQQQSGTIDIGTFTPSWATDEGGLSPSAPTFAELNGVLYAAVVGYNSSTGTNNGLLYWNSSKDGGRTWSAWQQVPSYSSHQTPALAAFQGSIYMAYVGTNSNLYVAQLTDASSNSWSQVNVNNQTCQYVGMTVESGSLAVYYVGTNSDLYRTATSTPTGGGSWSASQLIKYSGGNQTASGNLAVTTITSGDTDTTYIAYQGGTTSSASDSLFLTYSSNQDSATGWTLSSSTPQPATANRGGVSLTHNHSGLLLGYADKVSAEVVYVVQQSSNSGSSWTPFTTLTTPTGVTLPSSGSNTSFSLMASAASNDVLVAGINNGSGANSAINLSVVSELPPSTSLSSSQTESNLSAVGDLNGDGFDDLVVAANNVVVNPSGTAPTLATGLRLITGAATSSQITTKNDAGASSQTVQLAPWQGINNTTPVATWSGTKQLSVTTTASVSGRSMTSSADISASTDFTATAGDLASAQKLFPANAAITLGPIPAGSTVGDLGLISSAGYGDLNGDGLVDYLDPTALTVVTGANSQTWNLWAIRAAGDVNGNGVDDVLLSLSPQGPAYGQVTSGQPSALQSVLVDGSLFEVRNNQFSLALAEGSAEAGWTTAGLRARLDPYKSSELYDVASTSTSAYVPSLQNWFDPILGFKPGSLTAASTVNTLNPDTAESFAAPAVAIGPDGAPYFLFSGYTNSSSGAGLWMAYQQSDGSWTQCSLSVGSNASILSPSAVFYQGKLTIAFTDNNGYLHVAWCEGSPGDSAATWNSYQVETAADEMSQWNPSLVVEPGRLALYFPSNAGGTDQQTIRYLYSSNPFDASAYGNWGGSVASDKSGYSGISGTISVAGTEPIITSPLAATTFQGRTVLAFRSYPSSGSNLANAHILLLTQVASGATAADPSTSLAWVQTDTLQTGSNGVGLATDQALLYLTSTTYPDSVTASPAPEIWSLSPSMDHSGDWTLGSLVSVDGPQFSEYEYIQNNPFRKSLLGATVLNPFLVNGKLSVAWSGGTGSSIVDAFNVQTAELKPTIGSPGQQSLAGYTLDGDIDVNGDGFRDVLISDPSDSSLSVDNQYALFGGDYLNIASQVGTAGSDTLVGTALVDVIYSIGGDDVVISNGGADVVYTGSGDDQIAINGNAFLRIDAGPGFDVLQLAGAANQAYNFSLGVASPVYFAGTKLKDIELIDSRDYGTNVLSFDQAAVNAINSDRILFVTPDTSDFLELSSEFTRNSAFDTAFAGSLWLAYAAGTASTPEASSPALLYVLNPSGGSGNDWLSQHVVTSDLVAASASADSLKAVSASSPAAPGTPTLPSSHALLSNTTFGDGLSVLAYQANPGSSQQLFAIERQDGRRRQVVAYASSSANSTAEPGRHYDAIAGLLTFEEGELRKEITVPILAEAFAALGTASLSLAVEEWQEAGQHSLHLVLGLDREGGDGTGLPPALSGFSLTPASSEDSAHLTFRADTNGTTAGLSALKFQLRQRAEADSRDSLRSETVEILDQAAAADDALMLHLGNRVGVSLDRDQLLNQQVSTRLQLLFSLDRTAPTVSAVATPTTNGLYGIGTVIPITVTFSEAVTVDASGGLPTLLVDIGTIDRAAVYSAGSGSKTLTFLYTVQAGDRVQQLELASSTALALNGATIQDAAGNTADLTLPVPGGPGSLGASSVLMIDGVAPVVTSIASANANGTYGPGALVTLTARFSEVVSVNLSGGVPSLLLETGALDRAASYFSGSGTDTLVFRYTVQDGDSANDLDLVANAPLALNGATLQDAAGNAADLTLPAAGTPGSLAANAALVISGFTPPSLTISTATPVIEEGATLAVSIASDTLAPGTTTYWRFSGSGITAADFSPAGLSGSIALGSDRRAAFSRSIALDALTEGDEQLTLEFFADAARTQSLARSLFTVRDVVPKSVAGATDGRDVLIGTAADEIISGVPVVSALNGRGSYDTLTGNGGRDLFLLGTAAAVFYDDGNSSTPGSSDLAAITDFAAGDRVQLHGSAADYRLASGRVSGASGVMVYRLTPASGSGPAGSDELIGFLNGLTPAALTLTDPTQFHYV